jgi:tripartite-type tricarboxylate transporter receptor subunit TctC
VICCTRTPGEYGVVACKTQNVENFVVKLFLLFVAGTALLVVFHAAAAQQYPSKPLRIVVPFAAGSGADANPRFYGELVSKMWGQSIVVDNRPGGSGVIAVLAVKSAAADGYTLLTGTTSTLGVNPVVMKDLPYDPIKEFRPVILFGLSPTAFVVAGNAPSKTLKEFTAATKKAGLPLAVGNYSAGYELLSIWFGMATGLAITPVPYKGGSPVMTDVIGGQITSGMIDSGGAAPLIKEGRMRALAITAETRHAILPEVPTMKESGFPDFVSYSWSSIFVRSETPDAIVSKLHDGFKAAMVSPEGRAYQASRTSIIVNYTPQEIRAFVASDAARYRKIAQAAGIKPR